MYLLDTNVVSEATKARPNPVVAAWAADRSENAFISVLTVGEIIRGIERLADGPKRQRLAQWLRLVESREFADKVLPITSAVAGEWGRMRAHLRDPPPQVDVLIAATARVHDLAVVTRNVRDFANFGVRIVNPWAT